MRELTIQRMERFQGAPGLDRAFALRQLEFCGEKVDAMLPRFFDTFPAANTEGGVYPAETENYEWTTSFWSGMLWLLYEHTGQDRYLPTLQAQLERFHRRVEAPGFVELHDMGFLYDLSCYPAVLLREDGHARGSLLRAAAFLSRRWVPRAGILQAWGDMGDKENQGRMIIDCLMNLPLLFQAARLTGDRTYYDMARSHAEQAQRHIVRADWSTFHTYYMDVDTGAPRFGKTAQGHSDDSCWARGQAWGVYGFALAFAHTGDRSFLDSACNLLNYYLNHLPDDFVCYWDLCFQSGEEPRDTSAAAIVCCGILELLRHLPLTHPHRGTYENALRLMLDSLARGYTTRGTDRDGLLLHGVYSMPHRRGVDEGMIWGDYYYLEALYRLVYGPCAYWL